MNFKKWMPVVLMIALVGCNAEEGERVELGQEAEQSDQRRDAWPEGVAVQVDSANTLYAAQEYEAAAEIYRGLAEEHDNIGTIWFGLYMAENALGNQEAAMAAMERAESISPGLGMMHDAAEASGMGDALREGEMQMPAGHPPMDSVNPEDAPPLDATGG